MPEQADRIRKVEDEWVEIEAELADGSGYAVDPIQLRPGADDGLVVISNVPPYGAQVNAADLHRAVDLIEKEM